MGTRLAYGGYIREGVVSLERTEKGFVVSNLDTGIKARFTPSQWKIALENYKMWARMSKKRWA
jgi:hypothetical protein